MSPATALACGPLRELAEVDLDDLEPAARGSGAGTQIMAGVAARAAGAGADTLRISVFRSNVRGLAFWRRLGFEQVAAVGADPSAIALERPLAPR